jgi:phosphoribosylglycinamide formyltransferase-1
LSFLFEDSTISTSAASSVKKGLEQSDCFQLVTELVLLVSRDVTEHRPFRIGVLGSGQGSNFAAIADACSAGTIPAQVAVVLSDIAEAGILSRARDRGIPAVHLPPGKFRTKLDDEADALYARTLTEYQVELVALAGFMRVIKGELLRTFENRIVNIHPSLLPAFPGLQAWRQALEYGVKVTGCTVHFVDAGVDSGPIIGQQAVPVLDGDTAETLHQRIHAAEHELYPRCIAGIAGGQISIKGRRVLVTGPA